MTRCRVRAVAVRAAPWSAERWRAYYEANAEALLPLPWGGGAAWPEAERDAVLGETNREHPGEQGAPSTSGRRRLSAAGGGTG